MAPLEVPSADAVGTESRPLLVSDDEQLVDEVLRLAAAAGASIELVPSAGAARPSWRSAPLVLLGADATAEAQRLHLPDRSGVVVVLSRDDSAVLKRAVDLRADRAVVLPDDEPWLVDRLGDAVEAPDRPGHLVCVVGGRGGAGASTTAAALALTAMRMGMSPLLVDGDPLGGGVDLVVGGEDTEGLRWPDFSHTRGRVNGAALRAALPRVDQLTMLSWDRGDQLDIPVEAMRAVLGAAARSSDLVVVDLPRRVDEAAAEALARSTVTLLVVPAEVRAVAAASRVVQGLKRHAADIKVLVRGPAPTSLPASMIATSLDLPVVASIRAERGLEAALDRGDPPVRQERGPLARFCRDFLTSLAGERRAA